MHLKLVTTPSLLVSTDRRQECCSTGYEPKHCFFSRFRCIQSHWKDSYGDPLAPLVDLLFGCGLSSPTDGANRSIDRSTCANRMTRLVDSYCLTSPFIQAIGSSYCSSFGSIRIGSCGSCCLCHHHLNGSGSTVWLPSAVQTTRIDRAAPIGCATVTRIDSASLIGCASLPFNSIRIGYAAPVGCRTPAESESVPSLPLAPLLNRHTEPSRD
jgi:hypothetical protein